MDRFPSLLLLTVFLLLGQEVPQAQAQGGAAAGLDRMVQQLDSKFPFLEGYVIDVQGGQVLIDLKQGQDLKPGDNLKLLRYGEDIVHPVTKKKVGRHETDLGRVVVTEVRKDYSIARLEEPSTPVKKGDGVRSFFRKSVILVAPVLASGKTGIDLSALRLEIEDRLSSHPRFDVPSFDLGLWLKENRIAVDQLDQAGNLLRLQKKIDADYILMPQVSRLQGGGVLDYRLVSAVDGSVAAQSRLLADNLPRQEARQAPPRGRKAPSARHRGAQTDLSRQDDGMLEYVDKQEFPFEIVDFDTGDVNGDGRVDYAFVDNSRVRFYKFEDGKFTQVAVSRPPASGGRFLSIDVADINGNGLDEVFVTYAQSNRLQSYVLEMVKGEKRFRPIWEDQNLYFRVVKPPKGKPRLLVQEPAHDRPFRPSIYEYVWDKDEYEEKAEIEIPHIPGRPITTIYGLTLGNITPSKTDETIFLDNDYHLRIYSFSGRLLVKSDEYFGHDPRIIDVALKEQIPGIHNPDDDPKGVRFKGRIQLSQVGSKRYLLLPKNHRLGGNFVDKLTIINNCSLVFFGIDREGLHQIHETRKQPGYLAAFQVVEGSGGKQGLVHMATVTQEGALGLGKKLSTIYTYRW